MANEQKITTPIPDRRASKDRRLEEQEREPERRADYKRRQQLDRRGIHYSFKFVSPDALEELRKWLKANCEGEITIDNPDMEATAQRGQFRVQFERKSDAAKLRQMLGIHWPSWMG